MLGRDWMASFQPLFIMHGLDRNESWGGCSGMRLAIDLKLGLGCVCVCVCVGSVWVL